MNTQGWWNQRCSENTPGRVVLTLASPGALPSFRWQTFRLLLWWEYRGKSNAERKTHFCCFWVISHVLHNNWKMNPKNFFYFWLSLEVKKNFYWIYFLQADLNSFGRKGRISINLKKNNNKNAQLWTQKSISGKFNDKSKYNEQTGANIQHKARKLYFPGGFQQGVSVLRSLLWFWKFKRLKVVKMRRPIPKHIPCHLWGRTESAMTEAT